MSVCLSIIGSFGFSKTELLKKKSREQKQKLLEELKYNIEKTREEIDDAVRNFNNVTEPRLVDFYIYKIQAEQSRYDQLLCEYKQMQSFF